MNKLSVNIVFIAALVVMCSYVVMAGGNYETGGARSSGVGGASVMLRDQWSTSNNPGALGLVDRYFIGVAYESRYFIPEAAYKGLSFAAPLGGGTIGVIGHSFGYASYNDNRLGLSYARELSDYISLGVQVNYVQVNIGDVYGQRSSITGEVGALITPNENTAIGVHLVNPTRAKLADYDDERIPTLLKIGGSYCFSEKVKLLAQVDKDLELPINGRMGIEYEPMDDFYMRTGFSTLNRSYAFGIGYSWRGIIVDVSNQWSQQLGFGATASMAYTFGKRKP